MNYCDKEGKCTADFWTQDKCEFHDYIETVTAEPDCKHMSTTMSICTNPAAIQAAKEEGDG